MPNLKTINSYLNNFTHNNVHRLNLKIKLIYLYYFVELFK